MTHPWLARYPAGVAAEIGSKVPLSLLELLDESTARHADATAYRFLGRGFSFKEIDKASRALAAWLQAKGIKRGERVAVMMPNIPQYAVAVGAILRAGCVVVNVNPLLAGRELELLLKDAGAQAIVVLESHAATLQATLPRVPVKTIVIAAMGDMLGPIKRGLVNYLERSGRRTVPPYDLPTAVRFNDAVDQGQALPWADPRSGPEDIAVLQYTGGTTGPSKGVVLLHRNLVANVLQAQAWFHPAMGLAVHREQAAAVCVLPLHSIFGFSLGLLLGPVMGFCNILIANPRDISGVIKELADERFHCFPATNTLFNALAQHADSDDIDWTELRLCLSTGTTLTADTARLWRSRTGHAIAQSYGLSETSPFVACTVPGAVDAGQVLGVPLPSTEVSLVDGDGRALPPGAPGEIAVRGPQVMAGYWQRPDETARVMTATGFLRTGDLGHIDENGVLHLLSRKRDRIRVNGHDVFPNEVEEAVAAMPGILDVAAIGAPSIASGESIKLVVVRRDQSLMEADVLAFGRARLPRALWPGSVEFRTALPRNAHGVLVRRELRG
jgi:long-chain acyl-CoA synthetase